jgi:hypothetical protein
MHDHTFDRPGPRDARPATTTALTANTPREPGGLTAAEIRQIIMDILG